MPYEEDFTHEFKGHRNLSSEEVPTGKQDISKPKASSSRKSVSRNLCGFLNTGKGGTVYCGVSDDGTIMGLKLTQYQRDHVVGSLHDLMARYTPAVPPNRYSIRFVPVFGPTTTPEEREEMFRFNPKEYLDESQRMREHLFRASQLCWCDEDAKAQTEHGLIISDYIIEIKIHPWDPDNPDRLKIGELVNMHPLFADEEGKVYFRRLASLKQYSASEIALLAEGESEKRCQEIIKYYEHQISLLGTVTSEST
ncbi:hypothetical protein Btru_006680 [Bulinus truncatus]|nr:hypothetical protein Btru_006680 [Bulinus truncatus]